MTLLRRNAAPTIAERTVHAKTCLERALQEFLGLDSERYKADVLYSLAAVAASEGDRLKAEALWLEARTIYEQARLSCKVALVDRELGQPTV